MTFSIVATDGAAWGAAVASKLLAVGAAPRIDPVVFDVLREKAAEARR